MTYEALAGDIGGTHARFAIVNVGGLAKTEIVHEARYPGSIASGLAPLVAQFLEIFAGAYGTAAGNLALTVLASGGVYIAGGIAPKIIGQLRSGAFLRAFLNKGRLSSMVARMPVRVILTDDVALYGAAAVAADTLSSEQQVTMSP